MGRKGNAVVIVLIALVVVVAVGIFYFTYLKRGGSINFSQSTLQDTEISDLIQFLKQNGLQAAVVQKIDVSNNASTWIVKSTGEKIFLYQKTLGIDGWNQPYYLIYENLNRAYGALLLPDEAEVYDVTLGRGWDISSYITGHIASPLQGSYITDLDNAMGVYGLAPDGKYAIDYADQIQPNSNEIQLNSVSTQSGHAVLTPIKQFPTESFLAWSVDSRYILMNHNLFDPAQGIDIYDVENATATRVNFDLHRALSKVNVGGNAPFFEFIYPSTILVGTNKDNYQENGGVFSFNFANASNTLVNILPNEIKMVGLVN